MQHSNKKRENVFKKTQTIFGERKIVKVKKVYKSVIELYDSSESSLEQIQTESQQKKRFQKSTRKPSTKKPRNEQEQDKMISLQGLSQSSDSDKSYSIPQSSLLFRHQRSDSNQRTQNSRTTLRDPSEQTVRLGQAQRIRRSKGQDIYLLSVTRDAYSCWTFIVLGTQKIPYHVQLTKNLHGQGRYWTDHLTTCTCIDFSHNYQPCKHIYFVFTQVAKADSLIEKIAEGFEMKEKEFAQLDNLLKARLGKRVNNEPIEIEDDQEQKNGQNQVQQCPICFIEMKEEKDKLEKCPRCSKFMHKKCLDRWKTHKNNCPMCRREFGLKNLTPASGALEMLHFVDIANTELAQMRP